MQSKFYFSINERTSYKISKIQVDPIQRLEEKFVLFLKKKRWRILIEQERKSKKEEGGRKRQEGDSCAKREGFQRSFLEWKKGFVKKWSARI